MTSLMAGELVSTITSLRPGSPLAHDMTCGWGRQSPVDADAKPCSRRHARFQREEEVLVHAASLFVAQSLLLSLVTRLQMRFLRVEAQASMHHLAIESVALVDGVGQLRKGVGVLSSDHEELEALHQSLFASMGLCQRRYLFEREKLEVEEDEE